ncbi:MULTISPECIES: hypothetical protein [Hymenobacter]|uniref:Uncharacterized protein n=1 Tax=Hymenobacter lapidiphilus TaxID=2608003 RepID=A0A7Y7PS68_9BACT|nr:MULTISPECIES: hypothetical protein [Hymenobacter]NVO33070.1 hypothetical protein [Hymenobacter lapidiphilus]
MSKQTKKPNFGDDLDAPALSLNNDARLYGVRRDITPAPSTAATGGASEEPAAPPVAASSLISEEEWLKFSTFLRRSTYVRLKQSEYWDRLVLKKAVDSALCAFLDTMEGSDRSLPEGEQYRLNGKKLK